MNHEVSHSADHEPKADIHQALQTIIDDDIAKGGSTLGVTRELAQTLDQLGREAGSRAEQLANALAYLKKAEPPIPSQDSAKVSYGLDPSWYASARIMSIFDVASQNPDEIDAFLQHPATIAAASEFDRDAVLAVREWNNGAAPEVVAKILRYQIDHLPVDDTAYLTERFTDNITYHLKAERLLNIPLLVESIKNLLTADQLAIVEPSIDRLAKNTDERLQAALATAAKAAEEYQSALDEKAAATRRRETLANISENPAAAYEAYLMGEQYTTDKATSDILPGLAADRYLSNCKNPSLDIRATAYHELQNTLVQVVQNTDKTDGRRSRQYSAVKPHLDMLIPNLDVFNQLVMEYPDLLDAKELYSDWKESLIQARLRQQSEQAIGLIDVNALKEHDLQGLDVHFPAAVRYTSVDDMESDLREYFVYAIGDTSDEKTAHNAAVTESRHAAAVLADFARSDKDILQKDVMEPFKEFLENSLNVPGRTTFESEEAKSGGSPYKYESTTFAGHAITIDLVINDAGEKAFDLSMTGGGYDAEAFTAERMMKFAAFVEKDLVYPELEDVTIRPKRPLAMTDIPEEDYDKYCRELAQTRDPDETQEKVYDNGKMVKKDCWDLPYKGTPNQTAVSLLKEILGDARLTYVIPGGLNELPEQRYVTDSEPAEARIQAQLRQVFQASQGAREMGNINFVSLAEFKVSTSPEQTKKLHNLLYQLSRQR